MVLCRLERVRLKALTFDQRYARGEFHATWQTAEPGAILADLEASVDALLHTTAARLTPYAREWLATLAERQGHIDGRQAITPESPDTV